MGFFQKLLSKTGPYKLSAAQNATIAKYMFITAKLCGQMKVDATIRGLLLLGGTPEDEVDTYKITFKEDSYFGMAALAFHCMSVPPLLKSITFRDAWFEVSNPLAALSGASQEINLATQEIKRKHGIDVRVSQTDTPSFNMYFMAPHHITLGSCLEDFARTIDNKICKPLQRHDVDIFKIEAYFFCTILISEWYKAAYCAINNSFDSFGNKQLKSFWDISLSVINKRFNCDSYSTQTTFQTRYNTYQEACIIKVFKIDNLLLADFFLRQLTPCEGLDEFKELLVDILDIESELYIDFLSYVLISKKNIEYQHTNIVRLKLRDDYF